ncbi:hypothetical protein PSEUDO8BK_40002 [Pseudomonas sp. 8BK]|uniref:antirestriction protein ArdA n=1 Tax=Pseudomonas sp. 8BK TaxID=2653164 RepID=UPI0012F0E6F4|nr:antirestriction protein ArdA [Pseudomonas sp. 8BK]VXB75917.1 hypothetical protein PSEUDO8BK_40002 [Pseudomonas sp. 8BK]
MSEHIRIYVADLAAYNAGYLHGVWIDATLDLEDIQAQVDIMIAASPVKGAEEYAIHDFEGFDAYGLGEYDGLEHAHDIACFIEEYREFGGALSVDPGSGLRKSPPRVASRHSSRSKCAGYSTTRQQPYPADPGQTTWQHFPDA